MQIDALFNPDLEIMRFKQPKLLFRVGSKEIFENPMDGIQKESPFDFNDGSRAFDQVECIFIAREGEDISNLKSLVEKMNSVLGIYRGFCSLFKIQRLILPSDDKVLFYQGDDIEREIGRLLQLHYPISACSPNKRYYVFCQGIDHRSIETTNHYYQFKRICSRLGYSTQYLSMFENETSKYKGILKKVDDRNIAYSLWNLDVALYSKIGGIPWVLTNPHHVDIFIGIRFARNQNEGFTTGIAAVFDKRGILKGILSKPYMDDDLKIKSEDVYFSSSTGLVVPESIIKRLIDDVVEEFRLNSYSNLEKINVMKLGYFGKKERQAFSAALGEMDVGFALVEVVNDINFRLSDESQVQLNPKRGLTIPLNNNGALLFTTGNYEELKFRRVNPYTHEMGVPKPILINLRENNDCYARMDECYMDLFKLTSLHYQTVIHNDIHLPCPLVFAGKVAKLASYNIRPHDSLKNCPWFL